MNIDQDLLKEKLEHCCQDSQDLLHIMELIKEKIHATNDHQEKISFLTLAPRSWTIEKTAEYFSVSIRSVKSARELRKSSGILSNKPKRIGKVLEKMCKKMLFLFMAVMNFLECILGKKNTFLLKSVVEGNIFKSVFY